MVVTLFNIYPLVYTLGRKILKLLIFDKIFYIKQNLLNWRTYDIMKQKQACKGAFLNSV